MSGHQQSIFTIHESQLIGNANNNNGNGSGNSNGSGNGNGQHQQRSSQGDILIDTSSIPMTQLPMPPMQHQHLQPQQQSETNSNSVGITSQPGVSTSARVAPESQNVVYSVHPVFTMLDNHDALLIRQKADCTSTCCGFESVNTYTVRGKDGSPILKALECKLTNCIDHSHGWLDFLVFSNIFFFAFSPIT